MRSLLISFVFTTIFTTAHAQESCKSRIYNPSKPPQAPNNHIVQRAKKSPNTYYTANSYTDVYSLVKPKLAPDGWRNLKHRRAAGIESLIVLGAYESSFDWTEGRDWSNSSSGTACTEEAGMWQTSGNTLTGDLYKGMGLKDLFIKECSGYPIANDCRRFIKCTKAESKRDFATSYTWLVIRRTLLHHGPLIRKSDVYSHLRVQCMLDLEKLL